MFSSLIWFTLSDPFEVESFNNNDLGPIVYRNVGCTARNTELGPDGNCRCVDGYPDGDPSLSRGCFKCASQCPYKASCVYPGKCRCVPGYNGNGLSNCTAITPEIEKITPDYVIGSSNLAITVNYEFKPDYQHESIYCIYADTVVEGIIKKAGTALCPIPNLPPQVVAFNISFDNISWSSTLINFTYIEKPSKIIGRLFLFLSLVMIVSGLYLIQDVMRKKKPEESEELDPIFDKPVQYQDFE